MGRRKTPRKTDKEWDKLRLRAEQKAIELTKSIDQIPIPLQALAGHYDVKVLRFEKLISTGGIRYNDGKYEIVVGIRSAGVTDPHGTEIPLDSPRWDTFGPAVRFTIAHEIAHLIFYGLVPDRSDSEFLRANLDELEKACNHIAAHLLLPASKMPPSLGTHRFDVGFIAEMISRFKTSPETFIWRFKQEKTISVYKNSDGIIGLIRQGRDGWTIKACHGRGQYIIPLLGDRENDEVANHLEKTGSIKALRLPPEIERKLIIDSSGKSPVPYEWSDTTKLFELQWRKLYHHPFPEAVIFTLCRSDDGEKTDTLWPK